MLDWDSTNNNEPFWRRSHELDLPKLTADAGFDESKMFTVMAPSAYQIADAERSGTFQGGDFGGGASGLYMDARSHNGGSGATQT